MRRHIGTALLVTALGLGGIHPCPAFAVTYRWTDDQGTVHYSQRLDEVPERYRSTISQPPSPVAPSATGVVIPPVPSTPSDSSNPLQMPTNGWLGITLMSQPPGQDPPGVLVSDVLPNAPGDRAGFRAGDLIVAVGKIPMQELLNDAQAARADAGAAMTVALQRLPPGSRLKFEIVRGQEHLSLLAEFGTPTTEQRSLLEKRARASLQLQQIATAERWLEAKVSPADMAKVTASLGPLYREQILLLKEVMTLTKDSDLRALLTRAQQDRRLEVLHKLIAIYQVVETRNLPTCCGQEATYYEFSSTLRRFLPPQGYFAQTLDSAPQPTLLAIRSTLQFVEPYGNVRERIQEVDRRIKASDAAMALNADVAAIRTQLQANTERGIRDAALDARIAKLPDPTRTALRDYEKQLIAAVQQRKREAEAAEAERRKQKDAMDAGYEQLKQAKQREDERRRLEQEAAQARAQEVADAGRRRAEQKDQERGKMLAKFQASHVSSGDDLHDNPFKYQGQAVGVTDIRFKRMIEPGIAICETGTGRELLISRVPVDSFSQAGETKSLVVKVIGTQAAKNAMGGPITLTHLEYAATLP